MVLCCVLHMVKNVLKNKISINGLRIWAIYCVVFQHVLESVDKTSLSHYTHWFCTLQALYIFLLFSGTAFSFQVQPKNFRGYILYLQGDTLRYTRIYVFFFSLQIIYLYIESFFFNRGLWPLSFSEIMMAMFMPFGNITVVIWYMYVLIIASAIWPILIRLFAVFGFWTCFIAFFIIGFLFPTNPTMLILCYTMPVLMLAYRYGVSARLIWGRKTAIFGSIWLISFVFLVCKIRFLDTYYLSMAKEIPFAAQFTYKIVGYFFMHLNRICGAYFWMGVIGIALGKLKGFQKLFARWAFSSLDIYLLHKPFLLFIFTLIFIQPIMSMFPSTSKLTVLFLSAIFAFLILYCSIKTGKLMRKSKWLSYFAFGIPKPVSY
jgi:hypothetical protein